MEFKKKVIFNDPNSEPPKNWIWQKDKELLEFNYDTKQWVQSKLTINPIDELKKVIVYSDKAPAKNQLWGKGNKIYKYNQSSNSWIENINNQKIDYYKIPFTIEATQDSTTVYFRQSSPAAESGLDPLKVEVSTNNGETWTEITAAPAEGGVPGATLAELNNGDKVLIRGRNEAYGYVGNYFMVNENCNFYADKPCYVYGNIMSLVGGDDFTRIREVKEYAFAYFFSDSYTSLSWAWVLSKDGENLLLPATTLASSCYYNMFKGCTGLATAPELPAMTLAERCYSGMFCSCIGLTTAPELPATTLAVNCYNSMFDGCTSLTTAPVLSATTLISACYKAMFYGCTNLAYIKAMFTTTPGTSYTRDWVKSVNGTGTFVKNSAANWDVTGVNGIPTGWTVETAEE